MKSTPVSSLRTRPSPGNVSFSPSKANSNPSIRRKVLLENKPLKSLNNNNNKMLFSTLFPPKLVHPCVDPKQVFVGNFAPVGELPPTGCSVTHGSLPPALDGVYIRNGPNPQHTPLGPLHFFEGDGMLHSLKISNGHVTFSSRFVRTYKYTLERHAARPLFPNMLSGFHGPADLLRCAASLWRVMLGEIDLTKGFGLANTSLSCFANKLLALGESDLPYVITVTPGGDVKTIGRWDFAGKLLANMTAHPKIDASTGEVFAFQCSPIFPYLTSFRFDRNGAKQADVPILSVKQPTLIHDFAVTDRFIIFPETQLVVDARKLILCQGMPLISDRNKVPRIGVMPRYETSDTNMKWFRVPDFNAMHVVNAWDESDDVVTIVASNVVPVEHIFEDIKAVNFSFEKLRINTRTGEVGRDILSESNLEMGSVNPSFAGKRSRYAYMGVCEHAPKMSGVVKIDVEKGREVSRRFYGKGCFGGEPLFVARDEDDATSSGEDDGYVVTYVHDEDTRESRFVVMDAKSPELDVVSVVKLPRRVPYGFHGTFVSDKKLERLDV